MMRVYLSGGTHSGWQDKVIKACAKDGVSNIKFLDPRSHELEDESEYTVWDLEAVKRSDVVFAYMEKSNPSGFGLTAEVAYAKALGKTVILVDEKLDEQMGMVRHLADLAYTPYTNEGLFDGLVALEKLAMVYDN